MIDDVAEYCDYSVFGLKVRSNLPLPELHCATGDADPDLTIEKGFIPAIPSSEADGLNRVPGALVLVIPDIARYRIEGGDRIIVDAEPGVPDRNVRLFLLGSAFGVLLHQRGLLPLHANAIEIDGQAVAFTGASGAGKSTLAAWCQDRGVNVISDDVCVIGFDPDSRPYAAPGVPRLRLWADALELMGRDPTGLTRSFVSDEREKFDLPIEASACNACPTPLAAVYLLDRGPDFSIVPLSGVEAADAVFANTYRGEYLGKTGGLSKHWGSAVQMVREVPLFRVVRRWHPASLDDDYARLLTHARDLIGNRQTAPACNQP